MRPQESSEHRCDGLDHGRRARSRTPPKTDTSILTPNPSIRRSDEYSFLRLRKGFPTPTEAPFNNLERAPSKAGSWSRNHLRYSLAIRAASSGPRSTPASAPSPARSRSIRYPSVSSSESNRCARLLAERSNEGTTRGRPSCCRSSAIEEGSEG